MSDRPFRWLPYLVYLVAVIAVAALGFLADRAGFPPAVGSVATAVGVVLLTLVGRWAETIRSSCGTFSASRVSAASRITDQSDWLPMTMATGAAFSAMEWRILWGNAWTVPPGGFRLAIVNCWNLEAGLEVREQLALMFRSIPPPARAAA